MKLRLGFLPHLIGLAVFAFIILRINLSETFRIIAGANIFYLLLAAVLVVPVLVLEALRWNFILRQLGIHYRFSESFQMFASSLFIGTVTPARVGEFVRVGFLKGERFGRAFFSVFADRVSDVLFLMLAGYVGMFFFARALEQQIFWFSIAIVGCASALAIVIIKRDFVRMVLRAVFTRVVPERLRTDVKAAFYDFYSSFLLLFNVKSAAAVFLITFASWLVYYSQVFLLAKALGIDMSFIHLATAMSIAGLLSVLPISISGIGTRDAAFVFFFGLLGIRSEFAVALSALVLAMMAVVAAVCFPFWLRKPVDSSFFEGKKSG
ncbi:flippase-like domain-containing protein [Candidatus Woesearchaeota archaeon]|nr:flippase-like domain-containing protein [Candidatus Woesearchaeota archaeon]